MKGKLASSQQQLFAIISEDVNSPEGTLNTWSLTILLELMFSAWDCRLAGCSWLWFSHYFNLWSDRDFKNRKNTRNKWKKEKASSSTCVPGVVAAVVMRGVCVWMSGCCTTTEAGLAASDEMTAAHGQTSANKWLQRKLNVIVCNYMIYRYVCVINLLACHTNLGLLLPRRLHSGKLLHLSKQ